MSDISSIAEAFLPRLVAQYGEGLVRRALARWSWQVTTTFTGAGFAEVALENIARAVHAFLGPDFAATTFISWGRACDNSPACQKLFLHRFGTSRCLFDDILSWAAGGIDGPTSSGRPVRAASPKELPLCTHAHCVSHDRQCPLQVCPPRFRMLVELAGPPCPPFSKWGVKLGCRDTRFRTHRVWMADLRRRRPPVVVFENVIGYKVRILARELGDIYHIEAVEIDPRLWGVKMGRPRVYVVLTLIGKAQWNRDTPGKLHQSLGVLTATPVMTVQSFFADPDPCALRELTPSEQKHLALYNNIAKGHRLAPGRADVVDLTQTPKRGRGSLKDGSLPCFTTHSGSLYSRGLARFLSPMQMMRAMGFPVQKINLHALGLSPSEIMAMAGNGMSVPCVTAVLLHVILFVSPA